MSTFLLCLIGCSCHQAYFAVFDRCKNYHTIAKLLFELVSQISQAVHVNIINSCSQQLHAVDLLYLVHNITKCIFGSFALQCLILTLKCFDLCIQMLDLFADSFWFSFQKFCNIGKLCFLLFIICKYCITGQCLNTTHTCCNTRLRQNLKCQDLTGVGYMSTTTQLLGEITHRYHANVLRIFLVKQCHGTALLCLLNVHHIGSHRKCCTDLFIYQSLDLCDLLSSHRLEMSKVKTKSVRSYQRTLLLYMTSQNSLQCFLKQMSCTVILTGICTICGMNT